MLLIVDFRSPPSFFHPSFAIRLPRSFCGVLAQFLSPMITPTLDDRDFVSFSVVLLRHTNGLHVRFVGSGIKKSFCWLFWTSDDLPALTDLVRKRLCAGGGGSLSSFVHFGK